MSSIKIIEDSGLPERSGRINIKTWRAIKAAKGNSAFFPDGNQIIVGPSPFEPQYVLFAVNEDIADNTLFVSSDIKSSLYKERESLDY